MHQFERHAGHGGFDLLIVHKRIILIGRKQQRCRCHDTSSRERVAGMGIEDREIGGKKKPAQVGHVRDEGVGDANAERLALESDQRAA